VIDCGKGKTRHFNMPLKMQNLANNDEHRLKKMFSNTGTVSQ
jgi:hypothetical protein